MKKIMILGVLLSCLVISGCGNKEAIDNIPSKEGVNTTTTIFALGDSITAGYQLPIEQSWPSQLLQLLKSNGYNSYIVVNAGKSGDTSKQVKDRLEWSINDAKPGDIAVLIIGGNDGFQSVPVEILEKNIIDIIKSLQAKGLKVLLGGMKISTNLGTEYTTAFSKIYPKVANSTKVKLIPFVLEGVALKPELNLSDMIHPNEAGYGIIANTIFKQLEKNDLIAK